MIVIHHNKDLDGFSSGAICKLKYPDATLIGWDYKDSIPDFEQFRDQEVIMIDVTFPLPKLIELGNICDLTVIDHHIGVKRDIDAMEAQDPGFLTFVYIYEDGVAACEIGWKYLFSDKPVPYAITLLGRYDTWRQSEGNWEDETLPFQYAMRTYCTSAETFDKTLLTLSDTKASVNQLINEGGAILKYQEQQDMLACRRSAFEHSFASGVFNAICLNTRAFSSNTMKSVYDPAKHDLMVGFEYTGTRWTVSLRAGKPDVDVSLIAKARGGSGHKAAAGFECDSFEEIFN